jgi:hypothetical protein
MPRGDRAARNVTLEAGGASQVRAKETIYLIWESTHYEDIYLTPSSASAIFR